VVNDYFTYLTLMLPSSGHETFLFMGILNLRMTRCGWLQITQRRAAIPKRCIIRGMLSKQEEIFMDSLIKDRWCALALVLSSKDPGHVVLITDWYSLSSSDRVWL
jgi:hypothetical protein